MVASGLGIPQTASYLTVKLECRLENPLPESHPPEMSDEAGPEVCSCSKALDRQGTSNSKGRSPTCMDLLKNVDALAPAHTGLQQH